MADAPAKAGFGFLSQKTGPFPLWVWMAGGIGIWYFLGRKSSGTASGAPNQQTDPAGNIGSIDPATGYVYGTPEDTAALAANNDGASGGGGGGTTSTGTTAGQYADNSSWGVAAVNYLVGIGVDPAEANQAITLYLGGQNLTSQYQADVNLAIKALGAPPSLPGPSSNNPGSVVTPPSGGTTTPPPPPPPPGGGTKGGGSSGGGGTTKPPPSKAPATPSGVRITGTTSNSVSATWNKVSGASRYNVRITYQSKLYKSASTTTNKITVTGLRPDSTMDFHVAAVGSGGTSAETTTGFHTSR